MSPSTSASCSTATAAGPRRSGLDTAGGYQAGADNIFPLLGWCEEVGVKVVTLWLLSSDNLTNRPPEQMAGLLEIIEGAVDVAGRHRAAGASTRSARWTCSRPAPRSGSRTPRRPPATSTASWSTSPSATAGAARSRTPYGRCCHEHAARGTSLEELADVIDVEHIAEHLYTKGQPDPDLVIRTSGEQRLGGFLLWQSAHSEFYFCEALWPDFRRIDFLRAIRAYAERERRFGGLTAPAARRAVRTRRVTRRSSRVRACRR